MASKVTIPELQQMKRDGRKIVGVVVWDYQMALVVDRVGVEIMSVGDSVGINLWGQANRYFAGHFPHCARTKAMCGGARTVHP